MLMHLQPHMAVSVLPGFAEACAAGGRTWIFVPDLFALGIAVDTGHVAGSAWAVANA